jgi:hypothetical protein|tara:strand:+ start:104 stop:244 length:141 start_codon:yes stop_codon:yes gene_type:complete
MQWESAPVLDEGENSWKKLANINCLKLYFFSVPLENTNGYTIRRLP